MQSFSQQRIGSLAKWADSASLPGISQDTYRAIVDYVLKEQSVDGSWNVPGWHWQIVMTAVVLNSLASLHFEGGDQWAIQNSLGGINQALEFLEKEVEKRECNPRAIGEDLWDACQAATALRNYGRTEIAAQMADEINENWKSLYEASLGAQIRWCGPAYLA